MKPTASQLSQYTPGMPLGDIYYILFRHKWKIALCSLIGFAITGMLYKIDSPLYRSEAKLFVRYIISETKSTGPNSDATAKLPDERGASIMNTEREILRSFDLVKLVADSVGPEKILAKAGGGTSPNDAAALLAKNLVVTVPPSSSVVNIVIKHPDPEIVRPVLAEVISRYFQMHSDAHRAAGALGNSLEQEAEALKNKLRTTEDDLRSEKAKVGVVFSVEDAKKDLSNRIAENRRAVNSYESELAALRAVLEKFQLEPTATPALSARDDAPPAPPQEIVELDKNIFHRIERFRKEVETLQLEFTAENNRVKDARARLVEVEHDRDALHDRYPGLKTSAVTAATQSHPVPGATALNTASQQVTIFQARLEKLNSQYEQMRDELKKLDQAEGRIMDLTRQRELDAANSNYYQTRFEQSRINDTFGNGKVSGIITIQSPSQPFREPVNKKLGVAAIGGVLLGVGWAFLIELYLDRSVRRPSDIEKSLHAPLFLSIPNLRLHGTPRRRKKADDQYVLQITDAKTGRLHDYNTNPSPPMPEYQSRLIPFHETLRDRLISYFETKNLTHKPKLVAITGLGRDAGVTTTATGLARSLSETGEGNVLLVDMTVGQGAAQQFVKGKAVCGLDELLNARDQAQVDTNLFVVAEGSKSDRLSRNLPQRFTKLVPQLKSSDFDYVIFDMPPVSQLSITTRLAGFMDMVLLVVESERNDRDIVQQATELLAESKAHVGIVLNKTNSYVPARLNQELLNS
jgi:polysaccharide biosynthesis transport protein